jgi:hypothetical protein
VAKYKDLPGRGQLKQKEKIEESYNLRLARKYRNVVLECCELNFDYLFWESTGDVLKCSA